MALIVASSENTFEGAIVYNGDSTVMNYVYKVNKKSMYVGPQEHKKVMERWGRRVKGATWKKFMPLVDGVMVSFGNWMISEEEASRKDSFDKINEIKKAQKAPMSKKAEQQVKLLHKQLFLKKKGNYSFPSEIGNDRIIIIKFNDNEWSVLNVNGTQFLYDLKDDIYILFNKEIHKDGVNIVWPVREYEIEEKVAQVV